MSSASIRAVAAAGALNAAAAAASALAAVAITVVAGRTMPPSDYALFAVVWGLVFGATTVVATVEPGLYSMRDVLGLN